MSYNPASPAYLSKPGTTLPVGTTPLPITVYTTYGACTNDVSSATAATPACLHVRHGSLLPPLPPGTYLTKAVMLAPKGLRTPTTATVQVTLTA